jgi:hypothetical protein
MTVKLWNHSRAMSEMAVCLCRLFTVLEAIELLRNCMSKLSFRLRFSEKLMVN